jgi:hypothetical protein
MNVNIFSVSFWKFVFSINIKLFDNILTILVSFSLLFRNWNYGENTIWCHFYLKDNIIFFSSITIFLWCFFDECWTNSEAWLDYIISSIWLHFSIDMDINHWIVPKNYLCHVISVLLISCDKWNLCFGQTRIDFSLCFFLIFWWDWKLNHADLKFGLSLWCYFELYVAYLTV